MFVQIQASLAQNADVSCYSFLRVGRPFKWIFYQEGLYLGKKLKDIFWDLF